MKIAIGADHGGFDLKGRLVEHLAAAGHQVMDQGTTSTAAVDYPVFARKVAEAVSTGQAERGI
ncbi:MAG: RpiB/LacA/LacB family sugar-phosphate isomerase, partial [Candidatus Krumholzibacteriota bacterium]